MFAAVCSVPCAARAVPQRAAKRAGCCRRAIGCASVAAVIRTKAFHNRAARGAARTAAVGGGGGGGSGGSGGEDSASAAFAMFFDPEVQALMAHLGQYRDQEEEWRMM